MIEITVKSSFFLHLKLQLFSLLLKFNPILAHLINLDELLNKIPELLIKILGTLTITRQY